jgi:uncharacterized damage-inducible protein DinB
MAAQQTMSEKDMYLMAFEMEYQTTLKVLRAYPAAKAELKPSERSVSARELVWTMVLNQMVVEPILQGRLMPEGFPPAPATWAEVLAAFEGAHKKIAAKLATIKDEAMNGTVHTIVGPKKEADVRTGNMLWMMLNDTIHHRGQLSVYLRIAGGKVPSIYGPSGDEPWM